MLYTCVQRLDVMFLREKLGTKPGMSSLIFESATYSELMQKHLGFVSEKYSEHFKKARYYYHCFRL